MKIYPVIFIAFFMRSALFNTQVVQIVHKRRWILFSQGLCVACIDVSFLLHSLFGTIHILLNGTNFAYVFSFFLKASLLWTWIVLVSLKSSKFKI